MNNYSIRIFEVLNHGNLGNYKDLGDFIFKKAKEEELAIINDYIPSEYEDINSVIDDICLDFKYDINICKGDIINGTDIFAGLSLPSHDREDNLLDTALIDIFCLESISYYVIGVEHFPFMNNYSELWCIPFLDSNTKDILKIMHNK